MGRASYALWLKPWGAAYDVTARTIRGLADELGAPVFEPHVTLLAELDGPESQQLRRTGTLARQLRPFQVSLTEPSYQDEHFRCLFMCIEETPSLMGAHALARQVFQRAEEIYMPHLSLVYGHFHQARKRDIVALLGSSVRISFEVRALYLIKVGSGNPIDWREIAVFPVTD
jgi:2'-5' RNA ligase